MDDNNYIPTAQYNYVIGKHYLSTDDPNLATVFYEIKHLEARMADPEGFFFNTLTIMVELNRFAASAGLSDEPLLEDILERLRTSVKGPAEDPMCYAEMDNAIIRIHDCIPDICRLAEMAKGGNRESAAPEPNDTKESEETKRSNATKDTKDQESPCTIDETEGVPGKELRVRATERTMDMSVSNTEYGDMDIPEKDLRKGSRFEVPHFPDSAFEILEASEDKVRVQWCSHEYEIPLGNTVTTQNILLDNPYLSVDEMRMRFEYREIPLYARTIRLLNKIMDLHKAMDPRKADTTKAEQKVLDMLDELIYKNGRTDLYPLKALLDASNDWSTGQIVRISHFRHILLEGIDKGCLAPDQEEAWDWIENAAKNNDPAEFMDDTERWYDILMTATEEGNTIARDIMDRIWEPEQTIDED